ncbi:MAG: hypothetical protein M3160_10360 [Candidatus Eremiobacteraeota bacterium]|nr:hypothetical protein [Candidatus Eremiobacteraeota bacterium]
MSVLYRHTIQLPSMHSNRLRSLKTLHALSPSTIIAVALHHYFRNLTDREIADKVRIDSIILQRLAKKRRRSSTIDDELT